MNQGIQILDMRVVLCVMNIYKYEFYIENNKFQPILSKVIAYKIEIFRRKL